MALCSCCSYRTFPAARSCLGFRRPHERSHGIPEPRCTLRTFRSCCKGNSGILEKKGFLDHKQYGTSYQYFPTITEKEYGRSSLTGIIKDYFNDSYLSAVSAFVKEEKISVDELKELIEKIEQG